MRLSNRRNDRAFSLIELVIVVVIIGIIAAIAIPRLSRGVRGATESAVKHDLAVVRGAIDLYMTEHYGEPPDAVFYYGQMIDRYTDVNGATSIVKGGGYIYGPYLRASPKNPYNDNDSWNDFWAVATSAEAAARTVIAGGAGWAYYDGLTGGEPVFYANSDTAGVGENDF